MSRVQYGIGNTREQANPLHVYLPRLSLAKQIRLGHLMERVTSWLGMQRCEPCNGRAERLNQLLVFSRRDFEHPDQPGGTPPPTPSTGRTQRSATSASGSCWRFTGPCTGFGRRQCVTAPESQEPGAGMITHCCSGWFQYPWIEVCPGQPPRTGCSFCLW